MLGLRLFIFHTRSRFFEQFCIYFIRNLWRSDNLEPKITKQQSNNRSWISNNILESKWGWSWKLQTWISEKQLMKPPVEGFLQIINCLLKLRVLQFSSKSNFRSFVNWTQDGEGKIFRLCQQNYWTVSMTFFDANHT